MKAGWHLWSISLEESTKSLWITTEVRDLTMAVRKTRTFMSRTKEFRGKDIRAIAYHGTLDS